jgi:SAM-dependent methyltransferase
MGLRRRLLQLALLPGFSGSASYWERRYRLGGSSGEGSEGPLADFKARVLNELVAQRGIETVLELGCGDGRQLALAEYPSYLGLDVSQAAVGQCRERFAGHAGRCFLQLDAANSPNLGDFVQADLVLSLDVIYHLVEDAVYEHHLAQLFGCARRMVVIYASSEVRPSRVPHVRHRPVVSDVAARFASFELVRTIPNAYPDQSFCSFFVFERTLPAASDADPITAKQAAPTR